MIKGLLTQVKKTFLFPLNRAKISHIIYSQNCEIFHLLLDEKEIRQIVFGRNEFLKLEEILQTNFNHGLLGDFNC